METNLIRAVKGGVGPRTQSVMLTPDGPDISLIFPIVMRGRIARLGLFAIMAGLLLVGSLPSALSAQGAKDPVIGKWHAE